MAIRTAFSSAPPELGPRTVLVVDDDGDHRTLLERLLAPQGYLTLLAESAADARECLRGAAIDLLILDLMMPKVDGIELCRSLRAAPEHEDLPVIIMTARDDRESRVRAREAGASDFLVKPCDALELLISVDALLRSRLDRERLVRKSRKLERRVAELDADAVERQHPPLSAQVAASFAFELDGLATRCRDALRGSDGPLESEMAEVARELEERADQLHTLARRAGRRG